MCYYKTDRLNLPVLCFTRGVINVEAVHAAKQKLQRRWTHIIVLWLLMGFRNKRSSREQILYITLWVSRLCILCVIYQRMEITSFFQVFNQKWRKSDRSCQVKSQSNLFLTPLLLSEGRTWMLLLETLSD